MVHDLVVIAPTILPMQTDRSVIRLTSALQCQLFQCSWSLCSYTSEEMHNSHALGHRGYILDSFTLFAKVTAYIKDSELHVQDV